MQGAISAADRLASQFGRHLELVAEAGDLRPRLEPQAAAIADHCD